MKTKVTATQIVHYVPISKLKVNPKNPRVIKDAAFARLCESLKEDPEFFQARPIICNRRGVIIAGNQRFKAAKEIGMAMVPVIVLDNPALEAKRMLRDNISSGAWDFNILDEHYDIELLLEVGFTDDELAQIGQSGSLLDEGMLDVVPPKPEKAITKPGDLWLLGNHRLLCGDSAKPEDVDRLLDGQKIHLVNTDPPYGVKVEPRSNNAIAAGLSSFNGLKHHQSFDLGRRSSKLKMTTKLRPKDRPLANDFLSDEEFGRLLQCWFGNIARVLQPGRSFYIWGGYANCANYPPVLKASGLYFSQAIIWVKEHPVLTRKDFMGNHEWAFYGWREGAAHKFFGPNNATDVWPVKKVTPQNMIHLTEKPTELASRAIAYSSLKGENVLDLFGGSGSTLIACEHMKRNAFLMELDPLYCDVIKQRYQNLTGKKPVLARIRATQ